MEDELWYELQCSQLKDPHTHELLYALALVRLNGHGAMLLPVAHNGLG